MFIVLLSSGEQRCFFVVVVFLSCSCSHVLLRVWRCEPVLLSNPLHPHPPRPPSWSRCVKPAAHSPAQYPLYHHRGLSPYWSVYWTLVQTCCCFYFYFIYSLILFLFFVFLRPSVSLPTALYISVLFCLFSQTKKNRLLSSRRRRRRRRGSYVLMCICRYRRIYVCFCEVVVERQTFN